MIMLKQDYKSQQSSSSFTSSSRRFVHAYHVAISIVALGILTIIFSLIPFSSEANISAKQDVKKSAENIIEITTESNAEQTVVVSNKAEVRQPLALNIEDMSTETAAFMTKIKPIEVVIRPGDSLASIFQKQTISPQILFQIMELGNSVATLKNLLPKQKITLYKDEDQKLTELDYSIDSLNTLKIIKTDDQFHSSIETKQVDIEQTMMNGIIENSLYLDGLKAGLSDRLIMQLADIFGWDIDFALDLRKGDRFNIVYQKLYVDGEFIGEGKILAAEFVNQGQSFRAVLYQNGKDESDYYTPEGLSMRKAFIRNPVNFRYISSSLQLKRFHPILKRYKPHQGIDYRAKTGTPVYAAGDGKVIASAYNKYNGNYVFIQHGEKYTTKYLHFSKRKVKVGQRVKQGQVIGLVGATGLAEAPHLHYAFLVDGVYRNPKTIKLPQAQPIDKKDRDQFKRQAQPLLARLDIENKIYLAQIASGSIPNSKHTHQ